MKLEDMPQAQPLIEWKGGGSFNTPILWVNGVGVGVLEPAMNPDNGRCRWMFTRFVDGMVRSTSFKYAHASQAMLEVLAMLGLQEQSLYMFRVSYRFPAESNESHLIGYFVGTDRHEIIERAKKGTPEGAYFVAESVSRIDGHEVLVLG